MSLYSLIGGLSVKFKVCDALSGDTRAMFTTSLTGVVEYQDTISRLGKALTKLESTLNARLSESETNERKLRDLLETAKKLLQACRANSGRECVPYYLAAIDYFLDLDDAVADFKSFDGFDDDQEVFTAVLSEFPL